MFIIFSRFPRSCSDTIFSLQGRTLKFDTTASIEPHLVELDQINELIEVKLGGNTFGVEACAAIAKALVSKSDLQVSHTSCRRIETGRSQHTPH